VAPADVRNPRNTSSSEFVRVFGVGTPRPLHFEIGVFGLERGGDVSAESEAEGNMIVFGGVHAVAKRVGRGAEL